MRLAGRNAVVTGGSRGIGQAVAEALLEAGASVLVTARDQTRLDHVVQSWRAEGLKAHGIACDVSEPAAAERLLAAATEALGDVDVLVNNAGVGHAAKLERTSLDDWNRVMAVNATSAFATIKAFAPGMTARGHGRVVNIGSTAALAGARYISAYAASKHALLGLSRCLAAELASRGIRVDIVCPAFVDTPMTQQTIEQIMASTGRDRAQAERDLLSTEDQPRLVTPTEVADAVLSLIERADETPGPILVLRGEHAPKEIPWNP